MNVASGTSLHEIMRVFLMACTALVASAGPVHAQNGDAAVEAEYRSRLSAEEIALMSTAHTAETYRELLRRSQQHLENKEFYQAYVLAEDVGLDDFRKNFAAVTADDNSRYQKPELRLSLYLEGKAILYWCKFNLADCKRYFSQDYDGEARNSDKPDKYAIARAKEPVKAALSHAKNSLNIVEINRDFFQKEQLDQINEDYSQTQIDFIDSYTRLFDVKKSDSLIYINRLKGTGLLGLKYKSKDAHKDLYDTGRELGSKGFTYLSAHRYYEAMLAFARARDFFGALSTQNKESAQASRNDKFEIGYYPDVPEKLIAAIYFQKAWVAWCAADAADCRKFAENPVLEPDADVEDPGMLAARVEDSDPDKGTADKAEPEPVSPDVALRAKYPVQEFYRTVDDYPLASLDSGDLDPATPEATLALYRESCTALRVQALPLFGGVYRKDFAAANNTDPDLAGTDGASAASVCDDRLKQAISFAHDKLND